MTTPKRRIAAALFFAAFLFLAAFWQPSPPREPMVECPHCGSPNDPARGSNYCIDCGLPMDMP